MKQLISILVVGWLLMTHQGMAQPLTAYPGERSDTIQIVGMKHPPRWVVKLSPLAYFDVEGLYRVDVERLIGGRYSIQGGLGYGSFAAQPWRVSSSQLSDREHWRAQVEWRVYFNRNRTPTRWQPNRLVISKPLGSYYAIETFYKQVNAYVNGTLQRGCDNGNCQFFESYTARAVRYVAGAHFKVGRQVAVRLSDENNRLLVDYYMGLGFRVRRFEQLGVPDYEDARTATFNTFTWDQTSSLGGRAGTFPSFAFGIQVGYAF